MLSKREKKSCLGILLLLSDEDIFSLMDTVTKSISTKSRKEAVIAILQFTQSIDEFFKWRKISKELLLNYIYQQSWSVPRDADLRALKDFIIQKWDRLSSTGSTSIGVKPKSVEKTAAPSQVSGRVPPTHVQINNTYNNNHYTVNNVVNQTVYNIQVQVSPEVLVSVSKVTGDNNNEHESAVKFVKWFFSMLNSCNPDQGQVAQDFGPQHFWRDAQMHLEMVFKGRHVSDRIDGAELVAKRLFHFPASDGLLFNPNVGKSGLKIKTDAYGRKMIMVCGLIHRADVSVGFFCQSFGLVSDPAMNNFHKVKVTMLKMVEGENPSSPSLSCDSDSRQMEHLTASAIAATPSLQ